MCRDDFGVACAKVPRLLRPTSARVLDALLDRSGALPLEGGRCQVGAGQDPLLRSHPQPSGPWEWPRARRAPCRP
eukprot:2512059-Pyramimonas_sp.AAC.1